MEIVKKRAAGVCALSICFFLSSMAYGEDRALLVGMTDHQDSHINSLNGRKDIEIARKFVQKLGYGNIKILQDREATRDGILAGLSWLAEGVGAGDRALFYYSGHGAQMRDDNGDEEDGKDEIFIPWDTRLTGNGTIEKIIIDDEINMLLGRIAGKTFVLLDSCHSGSATKSLNGTAKTVPYEGVRTKANITVSKEDSQEKGYAALSACRDDQTAIATPNGSLFTLAMKVAVEETERRGKGLSLNEAREICEDIIVEATAQMGNKPYHPVVDGEESLLSENIFMSSSSAGKPASSGEARRQFEGLLAEIANRLNISTPKSSYRIGSPISLTVDVPQKGYLNIVCIGDDEIPVLLYPNREKEDNYIGRGMRLKIPNDIGGFRWTAEGPPGEITIYAFYTEEAINFWQKNQTKNETFQELHLDQIITTKDLLSRKASIKVSAPGNKEGMGIAAGKLVLRVQ